MTTRSYYGLTRFIEAAEGPTDLPAERRGSRKPGNVGWYGTADFDEAIDQARSGWIAGMERLQQHYRALRAELRWTNHHPVMRHDLTGVEVDIGRYMHRDPECMLDVLPQKPDAPLGRRRATIGINLTATTNATADAYYNRGAAVMALIDGLETANTAVKIVLVEAVRPPGGDERYQVEIVLKDHEQTVDPSLLAFTLCNVAMLRRLVFSLKETEAPEMRRRFEFEGKGRYGVWLTPEGKERFDVYIPAIKPRGEVDWTSRSDVTRWVKDRLGEQGVDVQD